MKLNLVNVPSHALQNEGPEVIVETLLEYGLDGVVVFPAYYTEVNEKGRWRTPPLMSAFEKPIFGQEFCRIERRSPFDHDKRYYSNTRVTPVKYKGHEDIWTPFIKRCKSRNLNVILAMVPFVAFDDVDDFVPRYFNNKPFEQYLGFLCPNHPDVMPFAIDQVRELTDRYGSLCDGLLLDHIEYPAYSLKEIFICFCKYCREKAEMAGIDVNEPVKEIEKLFQDLKRLFAENETHLLDQRTIGIADGMNLGMSYPNLFQYLNFKVQTITNAHQVIVSDIRNRTASKPVGNGAFAPTYAIFTGVDYKGIQPLYDFICPKFYPQHWTRMLKDTIKESAEWNNGGTEENVINAFMKFVGISDPSYIDDTLQVSSKLAEKEAIKSKLLLDKPFTPWIHCEGDARQLEIKLEILLKHNIKSAIFHEYMFLGEQKLNLIKHFIRQKK